MNEIELTTVILEVASEVKRAMEKFPPFRSAHEAEAIIREEMDEFTAAVRHGTGTEAYTEAKQLAAMAVRYLLDISERGSEQSK